MIDAVHRALFQFWSGFGVPAYLQGHVPLRVNADGSIVKDEDGRYVPIDPPYITFEVEAGDLFATSYMSAYNWHRSFSGTNVNRDRAQLLDRIAKAIPTEGVLLPLDNDAGAIVLERNPAGFQSYYDPDDEDGIVAGRTQYAVTFYTL